MQKITIIANEELYKALGQAQNFMPGCGIYLAPQLNAEILGDSAAIVADAGLLGEYEGQGGRASLIGLCAAPQEISNGDILAVKKPYKVAELIGTLNNIIAKARASVAPVQIGSFSFDVSARTLIKGENKISLTEKESDLILLLYSAGGEVSREELLREVWGYDEGINTHTVETHIYRIRQKLGKDDDFIGSSSAGYFVK